MNQIQVALEELIRGNRDNLDAYLLDVCKNETISDTKAQLNVYMLRLDGNNRPRINDFAQFLAYCLVDYCIPPSEIAKAKALDSQYNTSQNTIKLYKKAQRLFTDLRNSGEGGELLLSIMCQHYLKLPQILCKMPLKTNAEVHYHGADGIYGKYDENTDKFCLYWGESKLYSDVDSALSNCFDSLKNFLIEEGGTGTQRERDLTLFRDNLDFNNEELENAIVAFLDPDMPAYNKLEYRGVCLVGYKEDAYPIDFSRVETEVLDVIKDKIVDFKSKVSTRLQNRSPLETFEISVFLVPFSDVDAFRTKFLEVIECP